VNSPKAREKAAKFFQVEKMPRLAFRPSIVVFPENNRRGGSRIKRRIDTAAFVFFGFFEDALEPRAYTEMM
jgi:hypothetical protein